MTSRWSLGNARNPLWRITGGLVVTAALVATIVFVYLSPRLPDPKPDSSRITGASIGKLGTYIEKLGEKQLALSYETISGSESELKLSGVSAVMEEPDGHYEMTAPSARKIKGVWYLDGPMDIRAKDPKSHELVGKGHIAKPEPAVKWDQGIWIGLSTLVWEDLEGGGKGEWTLPPGWRRELDGRFVVDHGPVHWKATGDGALQTMDAQKAWMTRGFTQGQLVGVQAQVEGGKVQSPAADVGSESIRWAGPIHFQRDDGWKGQAASGISPRPPDGKPVESVDLSVFQASRTLANGVETLTSDEAHWMTAGLSANGNVVWAQPKDGQDVVLRAPLVHMREKDGKELPKDLPVGHARSEGTSLLTWGTRSITSSQMEVNKQTRAWRVKAPAQGRSEQGTFSANAGSGTPARWEFEGPVKANLPQNGMLRGDHLTWDDTTWIVTGRSATWNGARNRLSGPRIIRKGEVNRLPEGVSGAYAASDGDILVRADQGDSQPGLAHFHGRVDCQGQGWRLLADHATVVLGPDNQVKTIAARGGVTLRGNISEGKGEILDLDVENRAAHWQGRVKGLTEVQQ